MVWKYDNPFRYPKHEFEQLKTIILVMAAVEEFKLNLKNSVPVDVAAALNISEAEKEKAKKLSQSMADFFKGPMV
jgi:hypothetical protein